MLACHVSTKLLEQYLMVIDHYALVGITTVYFISTICLDPTVFFQ